MFLGDKVRVGKQVPGAESEGLILDDYLVQGMECCISCVVFYDYCYRLGLYVF